MQYAPKRECGVALKTKDDHRAALESPQACATEEQTDPRVEALVTELIGRVADKWDDDDHRGAHRPWCGPLHPAR